MAIPAISSNVPRKVPFECFQLDNILAYAYRYAEPDESEEDFTKRLLTELDAHFQDLGPGNVGRNCGRGYQGISRASEKYATKYGILLILDEVMCDGTYFAFEQEDVVPDILTIAKGLGGGYSPIAGLLIC